MQTAVQFEDEIPTGDEVWSAHNQMNFIAERMAQHFRIRVGLEQVVFDPILEVELLGACRVIDSHGSKKSSLRLGRDTTAEQLISVVRQDPSVLKSELEKIKEKIQKDPFFVEVVAKIDRYLKKLDNLRSK